MDQVQDKRQWNFTIIKNAVLENPNIPATAKLVYILLCRFSNKNTGRCYPGHSTIANMLGMHRNSIPKAIEQLSELGLVTVERRKGTSHLYHIHNLHKNCATSGNNLHKNCAGVAQKLGRGCTKTGHEQDIYNNIQLTRDYILSPDEAVFFKILQSVANYPFDREKDLKQYHLLTERYPELDILDVAKDWAAYKLDKPLNKESNPRSQLNTACKKSLEWGKNLKKQPPKEQKRYTHQREVSELSSVIRRKTMVGL